MTTDTVSDAEPVVQPAVDPLLTEPASLPRTVQLWQPWTLIVPAMLLLPFVCLAFSWQISPSTEEILLNKRHRRVSAQPTPAPQKMPSQPVILVPGEDEMLHRRPTNPNLLIKAPKMPTNSKTIGNMGGITALEQLFVAAPQYFPQGTEVEDLTLEQTETGINIAHVSLNATFWNSDYWAMDSRPFLTIQAIAHTLAGFYRQNGVGDDFQILLLRNGQSPGALGQYDVTDPIPLDASVLSKSSEKTPPVTVAAH